MELTSAATPAANRIRSKDSASCERPHLPELRLRQAIPYSIAGQLGYVLSQMGVLSALAHFRGAGAVGEFGLALALTTPAFMFVNMGARSSQASDVTHRYTFAEYGGLVISAAALATVASIAAGLVFAATTSTLLIVIVVAFTKAAESVSNLSYGAFQQAGRVDKVAISLLLRGAFTVGLFALLLFLGFSTAFAFLAQLLVWTVLAFARDYPLASSMADGSLVWPSTNRRRIFCLARETAPLGASHFLNSLLMSLPRLFVERSLGLSAVGLLTVATYFQQAGSMLFNAMSHALVNRFARLRHRNSRHGIQTIVKALFAFATIASAIGLLLASIAGEWVLTHIFGAEFAAANGLLVLVAVALCAKLYGMIPQSVLHAERRFKAFFYREVAALVVCAAFLAVCVPLWGLMGAGYAIVAAAVSRLLFMCAATSVWRRPRDVGAAMTAAADSDADS